MPAFDLPGAVRRIRRVADFSQRQLADRLGISKSMIAAAEAGTRDLSANVLARAAVLAGLRLALVDADGNEVAGMSDETVRDRGGRRFAAHLDTRYSDEAWWHGPHRYDRAQPWYTFDRDRSMRDRYRERTGIPADHQLPQPGDSPAERADARRREYWRRRAEERERAFLAGELSNVGVGFDCSCPPTCDELDDRSGRPVHAETCPCNCDLA